MRLKGGRAPLLRPTPSELLFGRLLCRHVSRRPLCIVDVEPSPTCQHAALNQARDACIAQAAELRATLLSCCTHSHDAVNAAGGVPRTPLARAAGDAPAYTEWLSTPWPQPTEVLERVRVWQDELRAQMSRPMNADE